MGVRVVQWATGAVGRAQLQEIIQDPDLTLVGVLVYSSDKAGVDAGTLCGLAPVGIAATDDKEAIFALKADVVFHAASKGHALNENEADIIRLLESGTSVLTTTSYNHLKTLGEGLEERFEAACTAGGSRFFAGGENPGFMLERLVMTATGLCKSIQRIDLYEATDVSGVDSEPMLMGLMGMGRDQRVESPEPNH